MYKQAGTPNILCYTQLRTDFLQVLFPSRLFSKGLMPRQASPSAHGPLHARPYRHLELLRDKRAVPSTAAMPHSPHLPTPVRARCRPPQPQTSPGSRRCPAVSRPHSHLPARCRAPQPFPAPRLCTCQQRGLPLGGLSPSRSLIGRAPARRARPRWLPGPDMAAAGGARGCSSFQRRAGPRLPALPGTRPSVRHGQLLLSSGLPSLDCVLGWWERDWDPVLPPLRPAPLPFARPCLPFVSCHPAAAPAGFSFLPTVPGLGGRTAGGRRTGRGRACLPTWAVGGADGRVPCCEQPCQSAELLRELP